MSPAETDLNMSKVHFYKRIFTAILLLGEIFSQKSDIKLHTGLARFGTSQEWNPIAANNATANQPDFRKTQLDMTMHNCCFKILNLCSCQNETEF